MANCPVCNHEEAYIGAYAVECPNVNCKHFSKRQYDQWVATRPAIPAQEVLDSEDPVDHPVYLWCWSNHHHDFGD